MEKQELLARIADLHNYAQSVRNDLMQIDCAIERLSSTIEKEFDNDKAGIEKIGVTPVNNITLIEYYINAIEFAYYHKSEVKHKHYIKQLRDIFKIK